MAASRNSDGTVTIDQNPSGGRQPGSNTTARSAPLAIPNRTRSPKVVRQPGRTVAGR